MSELFSPLSIRSITFKNRIAVSPMCQYSAEDGFANDWHFVHLGSRAVGGASLIIQEATAVSPEGRISPGDLGIWKDEHIAKLKTITDFITSHGAVPGIQLAHAGRKASYQRPWEGEQPVMPANGGWTTVAPSPIALKEGHQVPQELDAAGIQKVIADFKAATIRARTAGYKLIEIHAAHGYLLNEFLSTLTNHRTDQYGGSFENRIRLLLEIVDATRETWSTDLPLFVRISATDWVDGGWTIDDSVRLAAILKTKDVDLIDCSSGGLMPGVRITTGPGYQVSFATTVKKATGILTGAVGMITTAQQANAIIQEGQADMVLLARQSLRDPYFPLRAAAELGVDIDWPVQYLRAKAK